MDSHGTDKVFAGSIPEVYESYLVPLIFAPYAEDLARRFPKLAVDANAIFIRDGPYYTSAGVTAGLELALALVEEDHGAQLAIRVAREMVVHHKRAGGQEQYSEPLRFQVEHQDRLGEVACWLSANLSDDLSVEHLAHFGGSGP